MISKIPAALRLSLILLAIVFTNWFTWNQAYKTGALDMLTIVVEQNRDRTSTMNNCAQGLRVMAPL